MRWLVTGGAGYIGSHVVQSLLSSGYEVSVVDNLSTGNINRLPPEINFFHSDILDTPSLTHAMKDCNGVIHLAALKSVSESFLYPLAYWDTNVLGTMNVLRSMQLCDIKKIIFSSTANIYENSKFPISEDHKILPKSPYGNSKLSAEMIIRDFSSSYPLEYAILRYFNVAGCSDIKLIDNTLDTLISNILESIRLGVRPEIYGVDYDTHDGSAMRDYIHASDVANAHSTIASHLGSLPHNTYNIGTGKGITVLEVVRAIEDSKKINIDPILGVRRHNDIEHSIAQVDRIYQDTGWKSQFTIHDVIDSLTESLFDNRL